MKYKKGSFVVVPNLESIRGKPPEYLSVFFWLCTYSNNDGTCFPSRAKLAKDCGLTDRTVDKYIELLIEDKLIEKKKRKNKTTGEWLSNLYQIMLPQRVAKKKTVEIGNIITQGGEDNHSTHSETNIPITIPNINYTNLTISTADAVVKERKKSTDPTVISVERLAGRYSKLFKDKYGFYCKTPYAVINKTFRELLLQYNELQLSYLLIIYFNWAGMDDKSERERNYIMGKTHDLFTLKFNINQYEAYARNVAGYSKEFDSTDELLPIIAKYYTDLTNSNSNVKLPSLLQR